MRRTLVCLANSYKHGGRCVAGVCVEDGSWLRLRGRGEGGALQPSEYGLDDGSEVRLLDVFEAELHYPLPSDAHPEDWVIASERWRRVERPSSSMRWRAITERAEKEEIILRGYGDRIAAEEVRAEALEASLALIRPTRLWWWIREERGKRKCRALFHRNDVTYDFALTDPHWLQRLDLMPAGIYPMSTFLPKNSEVWLTVSLSEVFGGWHYKLVAGVIVPQG